MGIQVVKSLGLSRNEANWNWLADSCLTFTCPWEQWSRRIRQSVASWSRVLLVAWDVRLVSLATSHISLRRAFSKTTTLQEILKSQKTTTKKKLHIANWNVKLGQNLVKIWENWSQMMFAIAALQTGPKADRRLLASKFLSFYYTQPVYTHWLACSGTLDTS